MLKEDEDRLIKKKDESCFVIASSAEQSEPCQGQIMAYRKFGNMHLPETFISICLFYLFIGYSRLVRIIDVLILLTVFVQIIDKICYTDVSDQKS